MLCGKSFLLLPLLMLGAFVHANAQTGWKTFKHPQYKYTISYPADWVPNDMTVFLVFSRPNEPGDGDKAKENVNVAVENRKDDPIALDKLVEEYREQIKQLIGPKGVVKDSKTTVGGLPAFKFDELFESQGAKLHVNQYVVIKNNIAYIFTFTAQQTTYPKYQPTAMKIINSFKLPKVGHQ